MVCKNFKINKSENNFTKIESFSVNYLSKNNEK